MSDEYRKKKGKGKHEEEIFLLDGRDAAGVRGGSDYGAAATQQPQPAQAKGTDPYFEAKKALLIACDEVNGITSTFEAHPTTGALLFKRNAKNATRLANRVIPDKNTDLIKINTLSKALGTLRGALHVLETRSISASDISDLQRNFEDFKRGVETAAKTHQNSPDKLKKSLNALHETFHLSLLTDLQKHGLLEGIERTPKKQQEYLVYLTNLAGLLDPAPIVQTICTVNEREYTETCYPMTVKTQEQKDAIETALRDPAAANFYGNMSPAFQLATKAFQHRLTSNETLMSPQLRPYIREGLTQAFAVEKRLAPMAGEHEPTILWSSRSGTLAYTGGGESREEIKKAAAKNLRQLKENINRVIEPKNGPNKQLAFLSLVTDAPFPGEHGRESLMAAVTNEVVNTAPEIPQEMIETGLAGSLSTTPWVAGSKNDYKSIGVNSAARLVTSTHGPNDSPWAIFVAFIRGLFSPLFRIKQAIRSIFLTLDHQLNNRTRTGNTTIIPHIACKSGKDRTGTVEHALTSHFIISTEEKRLGFNGRKLAQIQKKQIEDALVAAGHNVVMASILCPGAPGMKSGSQQGNLLGKHRNKHFYLKSAGGNKASTYPLASARLAKKWSHRTAITTAVVFAAATVASLSTVGWDKWIAWVFYADPGLLFGLLLATTMAVIALVIKKRHKDMLSASAITLVIVGVAFSVLTIAGVAVLGQPDAYFTLGWQLWTTLIDEVLLLGPVASMVILGFATFGFGYLIGRFLLGDKLIGKWKGKSECEKQGLTQQAPKATVPEVPVEQAAPQPAPPSYVASPSPDALEVTTDAGLTILELWIALRENTVPLSDREAYRRSLLQEVKTLISAQVPDTGRNQEILQLERLEIKLSEFLGKQADDANPPNYETFQQFVEQVEQEYSCNFEKIFERLLAPQPAPEAQLQLARYTAESVTPSLLASASSSDQSSGELDARPGEREKEKGDESANLDAGEGDESAKPDTGAGAFGPQAHSSRQFLSGKHPVSPFLSPVQKGGRADSSLVGEDYPLMPESPTRLHNGPRATSTPTVQQRPVTRGLPAVPPQQPPTAAAKPLAPATSPALVVADPAPDAGAPAKRASRDGQPFSFDEAAEALRAAKAVRKAAPTPVVKAPAPAAASKASREVDPKTGKPRVPPKPGPAGAKGQPVSREATAPGATPRTVPPPIAPKPETTGSWISPPLSHDGSSHQPSNSASFV